MTEAPWTPSHELLTAMYGPWRKRTPDDVVALMDGYDDTWFIAGGWAIEAFTGVPRPHDDCDISVLHADVESFRDFDVTWPLLAPDQQRWLQDMLRRTLPHHPWLDAPPVRSSSRPWATGY